MSNLAEKIALWHAPMDKGLLRALSLLLGFYHVAMVMWDPEAYGHAIGGFNAMVSPLMIWAMCSSMVFGLGFKPRAAIWQLVFSPYVSMSILIALLVLRVL